MTSEGSATLLLQFCAQHRSFFSTEGFSCSSWQWTNHKDEGSARVLPDKRELGGTHQRDHSLLGIPLPRPIPILYFLARSREAGPVPARYPIGSVTTVYNFHTLHCKHSPCPELAVTQRLRDHRDTGNFPGFSSPCTGFRGFRV